MRERGLAAIALMVLTFATPAHAASGVRLEESSGDSPYEKSFRANCPPPHHAMWLIYDDDTKGRENFCSAEIPHARYYEDRHGKNYVLLEYVDAYEPDSGHRFLDVFQHQPGEFIHIARVPMSLSDSIDSIVARRATHGLKLSFKGKGVTPDAVWIDVVPDMAPGGSGRKSRPLPPTVKVTQPEDVLANGWCKFDPTDSITLIVTPQGSAPIETRLCVAYGNATANAVIDPRGRTYVILQYVTDRSSPSSGDALKIFRLGPGHLTEVLDAPISWRTSIHDMFVYDYKLSAASSNGLRLNLREKKFDPAESEAMDVVPAEPGSAEAALEAPVLVPLAKARTIWIDP